MALGTISSHSFHKVKELFSSTLILAYYSQARETIIAANASNQVLSTVLLQVQEDRTRRPQASELHIPQTKRSGKNLHRHQKGSRSSHVGMRKVQ
ncbi:hypothetical protein PoB_005595200 [Plakobranchus ocellatus]|uniref:Reverse transcriptase/retrotransposon-derived protein RNase H-like domain-containing protein n=1 Tax=Plakobranchus ocellatus TaxID=259542 RepID=A0AAV4CE28_9GAST|nr:hypothetical protein PoB_005595200 [Plakobranchus ocellatus]